MPHSGNQANTAGHPASVVDRYTAETDLVASVAICTYQRYDCLEACLTALGAQSLAANCFEILVVDNSPDSSRAAAEAARYAAMPNLRWIYEATPGLSNARNVAAQAAKGGIIAYIDDDAFADATWLESLLGAYEELGPIAFGIGGQVRPRFPRERPAWLSDGLLGYLSVVDNGSETRLLRPGEWVAGANVSYRRDALLAVGGFSAALGRIGSGISLMSNDETELAERLEKAGGLMGYAPDAAVDHLIDETRLDQSWFRRRIAWQAVSDFVRAPNQTSDGTADRWRELRIFLAHQPPHLRTLRALTVEQDATGDLPWQMSAVYGAIVCLLSGVADADD